MIKQKYSNTPTDLLPIGDNAMALHEAAEQHAKRISDDETDVANKREQLKKAEALVAESKKSEVAAKELLASLAEEKDDKAQDDLEQATAKLAEATESVAQLKEEIAKLEGSLDALKKRQPPRPQYAMSVRDRAKPADTKNSNPWRLPNSRRCCSPRLPDRSQRPRCPGNPEDAEWTTRTRPMDHQPRQPPDRPRDGESHLASPTRSRHRPDRRQLRCNWQVSITSATARHAGLSVRRRRLVRKTPDQGDHAEPRLSTWQPYRRAEHGN